MAAEHQPTLIDLDDTDLELRYLKDDIRGHTVIDRDGHEVGKVDGLIIDEHDKQVRLLRIGSGGLLGFGKTKRLVPVEAVTRIDQHEVYIDRTKESVADSSPYDPPLRESALFYQRLYGYYGYAPFWAPGGAPRYPLG
ncbi:PRC-barrel domain-containing protein [Nocardia sp. CDC159]|uniref:PRC-barrel domain-containing protein n=1 Tax=Nocardia pulmonis TaxID=2951408 RepID=A0A9X2J1K5_9NOCA|nr:MULTISPECIES: PRC-barrel domain-containing protein [Nocardia]MCM6778974.1 PRC-barrel domain-containing protein [Nocardia pulmonis]MCM6791863.1 PRC-barrel domain-containing protein [Nocardia sp. CDC159]